MIRVEFEYSDDTIVSLQENPTSKLKRIRILKQRTGYRWEVVKEFKPLELEE